MAFAHAGQLGSINSTTSTASSVCTLTTGIGVGGVAVLVHSATGAITVSSVADSRGNTWQIDRNTGGSTPGVAIASAKITTSLQIGDTITATLSAANNRRLATVDGWTGLDQTTWFETSGISTPGAGTPVAGPSITVSPVPALMYGIWDASGAITRVYSAPAGWTQLFNGDNGASSSKNYLFVEWKRETTGGSVAASANSDGNSTAISAAYAETAAASVVRPRPIFVGL